jgi:ribosomal protein L14E/L6E/L27E/ribosomal protein L34E
MPIQPYRTRTLRRIKVKTLTGFKVKYKKRKPKIAHCSVCKSQLHGVPRDLPYKIRQLPKSQRRPERMYSGVLCSKCLKLKLEEQHKKKSYLLEVGRVCIKNSGREAGSYCVIVEKKDDNFVIIDGQVKRRRCNIDHLIALDKKLDIKKGAATAEVIKGLKEMGVEVKSKKEVKKPKEVKKEKPKKETKKTVKKAKKSKK